MTETTTAAPTATPEAAEGQEFRFSLVGTPSDTAGTVLGTVSIVFASLVMVELLACFSKYQFLGLVVPGSTTMLTAVVSRRGTPGRTLAVAGFALLIVAAIVGLIAFNTYAGSPDSGGGFVD